MPEASGTIRPSRVPRAGKDRNLVILHKIPDTINLVSIRMSEKVKVTEDKEPFPTEQTL